MFVGFPVFLFLKRGVDWDMNGGFWSYVRAFLRVGGHYGVWRVGPLGALFVGLSPFGGVVSLGFCLLQFLVAALDGSFSLRKGGWIAISLLRPNGTASTPLCRLEFSGVYMADSKVVILNQGSFNFLRMEASFFLWNKFRNAPASLRDEGDSPTLHFQPPATFCG
ncbi:hypothetical protein U1Q18_002548 [Sarracenia purpurea var. burkii]